MLVRVCLVKTVHVSMAGQRNDYGKRLNSQPENLANEGSKRRNPTEEGESNAIGPEDTVYRYLCPLRRIGSIIGVGGDIAKQLRADTHAKIRISETIPGCEERVVTIYSSGEETNSFGDNGDLISPAQDALFRVHDRIIAEETQRNDGLEEPQQVTVRLLVPSDQTGCVIGKGGQVVQSIRSETGAQVRILSSEHLPPCALTSDELIQISGEAYVVRKALYHVSSRLHNNPSRSQHLLLSSSTIYQSGGAYVNVSGGAPLISSLVAYGGYRNAGGDWSASMKEFSLRLVCPTENIGAVIGKGGGIIKQIRQESGASIKIDTSAAKGEDCIISVSAKETFEEASPTIDATMRLQPRCSWKTEKESNDLIITTRLLVPGSKIGCLIGKGGAVISEMRNATRATIRIFSDENLPKVASADDEMVQITGDLGVASNALLQVMMRLRANLFEMEGTLAAIPSAVPLVPVSLDAADGPKQINRDVRSHTHGYSTYSGEHDSKHLLQSESNADPQICGRGGYGGYGIYTSGRSGSSGLSSQNPIQHGKSYGY